MIIVNVHEAKTQFSKLLDRAHRGEEIILAKGGKPFAKLVPLGGKRERVPDRYTDDMAPSFFDPLPDEELEAWEP
ncbi:MAG: type II toxin-antitoxin system prevent-host-death family antitoxin [Treponema sp.]|nr:type II toxin-antitoxin system prevent-host-death family antitoxin [Treponema sp.]